MCPIFDKNPQTNKQTNKKLTCALSTKKIKQNKTTLQNYSAYFGSEKGNFSH